MKPRRSHRQRTIVFEHQLLGASTIFAALGITFNAYEHFRHGDFNGEMINNSLSSVTFLGAMSIGYYLHFKEHAPIIRQHFHETAEHMNNHLHHVLSFAVHSHLKLRTSLKKLAINFTGSYDSDFKLRY